MTIEFREVNAHPAGRGKAVEIARRRQEAGVENVRRRFARLGTAHMDRELVSLVVGILSEKRVHGMLWPKFQSVAG